MTPHSIVRTKAGRAKVESAINDLAIRIGAEVVRESHDAREVYLRVVRFPYYVAVDVDGREPIDVFLGHWNVCFESGATYPREFPASLNTCHYRKATSQASTLEGLLLALETGFGFLPHTEQRSEPK